MDQTVELYPPVLLLYLLFLLLPLYHSLLLLQPLHQLLMERVEHLILNHLPKLLPQASVPQDKQHLSLVLALGHGDVQE